MKHQGAGHRAAARAFYAATGYAEVARIPDFLANGEEKITYVKPLG